MVWLAKCDTCLDTQEAVVDQYGLPLCPINPKTHEAWSIRVVYVRDDGTEPKGSLFRSPPTNAHSAVRHACSQQCKAAQNGGQAA